ncbi:hypothetical protein D3C77_577250 [compost metagenome]
MANPEKKVKVTDEALEDYPLPWDENQCIGRLSDGGSLVWISPLAELIWAWVRKILSVKLAPRRSASRKSAPMRSATLKSASLRSAAIR